MARKPTIPLLTNRRRHVAEGTTRQTRQRRTQPKGTPCDLIICRSDEAYTCQVSTLIILNARDCPTPRLIRHYDSRRTIEVGLPRSSRLIPFEQVVNGIGTDSSFPIQPGLLDSLEVNLVGALRALHAKNISFPVSIEQLALLRSSSTSPEGATPPRLYLMYNKRARWASDAWSSNWRDEQLASAKSFFHIAKVLSHLSNSSSRPVPLDPSSQHILAIYLGDRPAPQHIDLCSNAVALMTAELAHATALAFVMRNMAQRCCDVLDSFFGTPLLLPEPGTSPDAIYLSSLQRRAYACGFRNYCGSVKQDDNSDDAVEPMPAATFTRLVCCRAEAAMVLREPDAPQWWRTAMALYDAFLSEEPPDTALDRICAFDLYRYRDKGSV